MDLEFLIALVVPLLAALIFRVPRRTLLLAKETEILARLDPRSESHRRLNAHVEELVEREIESNEGWLRGTTFVQGLFFGAYGLLLLLVGLDLGGWWLSLAALGALILISLLVGCAAWLLPADSALNRWLRAVFRVER